ncbi:hypothetical protein SLEP1_g6916 [Rubroshorea leprosula]|uniref:Uncharacterized protein n=1 Tax=Rubroshorea leprosula TaxID=152421 RepID=A0AAV5I1B2_9ROSI|nr:hypothetical protein SLEP1_g6916 [Rubroshorea leprosula]
MNAGALFFSPNFHSLHKPKNPPDFSTRNKASPLRTQFRVGVHNRFHVFRVSVWNLGRRRNGKVYADVREMPESIRESVKFKDGLEDIVCGGFGGFDPVVGAVPETFRFRKYEHCHTAHVGRVQLDFNYCWFDIVIFLLGYLLTQIAGGIWADTVGSQSWLLA